jgi:HPt (histidine-containing phosphotransfer) domain-containing protein
MDDYLTKPLDRALLAACLERWLAPSDAPVEQLQSSSESPLDWQKLLVTMGNEEEFAAELVELFVRGAVANVERIATALRDKDLHEAAVQAHELKGAAANVQAAGVLAAADQLEAAALNADVEQLGALAAALRRQVEAVAAVRQRPGPQAKQRNG